MRTYGFASGVTLGSDWIGGGLSSFIDSPLFVSFGSSAFCSASGSIAGGLSTGADGAALLPSDFIMQQPSIKDNHMTWNTISIYIVKVKRELASFSYVREHYACRPPRSRLHLHKAVTAI